jgi:hypothetical protein
MDLNEFKALIAIISQAPSGIRIFLTWLVWVWLTLIVLRRVLNLISQPDFTSYLSKLWEGSRKAAVAVGRVGDSLSKEVGKALELPEPYPRIAKIISFGLMVGQYLAFVYFFIFGFAIFGLSLSTHTASFSGRMLAITFSILVLVLARFYFVQAEKERVSVFKKKSQNAA